ncbi:tripartite motif-containing protein 65 [Anguilla anguilla]|uniref:tripartite motif-containing protein 65 n=1 Tax=Anguilla anguilla TaxID=7936 RepID=UPI0015AAB4FD|nr:tripartite motif-containing protein 65 [Anguilla anguilla]XP_035260895.1 tripartite motif-containing protein 65 [Anguilla anguilla]XP_035260896.1 tripartite motif-containing protein 65 [Anguilla anguilla]XP_035260897.1 tripartite motif-containing protein 65 [Anguilla anguilla]
MESSNLSCVICFERFNVPVTIPCGHTFCLNCITVHWDTKAEGGLDIQCPICNETFNPRPILKRNVSLSLLTETAAHCVETRGAIPVSRQSNTVPPEAVCDRHTKPLVIYCTNDNKCVCYECAIRECDKHDKVLVEVEREKREEGLRRKSGEVEKHMEDTEKSITELTENIAKSKVSLQQTSLWMNAKFAQLVKVLAEKQECMMNFIEQERQTALTQAEAQLATLEDRAQRLRETQGQIAALNAMPDIQFIQESRFVEVPQMKETSVNVNTNLQDKLSAVTEVLSRISKLVLEDLEKAINATVGQDKQGSPQDKRPVLAVVPSPATPCYPAAKEGLSAFHCALTFDPRTANANLQLSQGNRRAEHLTSAPRPVHAHEARFDTTWQVLCFQGFTHGQHYWEVEVSKPWAYLGVTYQGIPRKEKGKRCMVGMNELSWSLQLDERQLSAWHNGRKEAVAGQPQQHRIGMLLDYEAGTLTYYGDGQARLHAFHCAFSQELFPACWIGEGVSVTLCPP